MRIKEIEIYGYGKWVDNNFSVNEGLQVFLGENEAGKSTLMSFIHSILYGFPTRTSRDLRYEPRESSKYGGKIIVEDERFGEVSIVRVHGKVTGDVTVTLADGAVGSEELLETILYEIDQATFKNIFSFSLTDIEHVHQLDKNKLNRYLFTIGALGTEHYLELVDDLEDEANELYRPSGRVRPLNLELEAIEQQEKELLELEKYNEQYLLLLEESKKKSAELKDLEKNQKDTDKKLTDLLEIKKEWHVFEEIQTLEMELSKIQLPPLKEDGFYLLEEYKKELNQLTDQLQELEKQSTVQKEKITHPKIIESYQQNKKIIHELEDELPEIIEQLSEFQALESQQERQKQEITFLKNRLQIKENQTNPITFTAAEQEVVLRWLTEIEAEKDKIEQLSTKMQQMENDLNAQHHKLDQLEAVLWSGSQFETIQKQIQTSATKPAEEAQQTKNGPVFASLLASGGLFLSSFLLESPTKWAAILIAILVFVFTLVFSQQKKKKQNKKQSAEENYSNELLTEQFEKQLELKEQWRTALGEVDVLQLAFEKIQKQFDQAVALEKSLDNNWQNLLVNHQLPDVFPIQEAEAVFENTRALLLQIECEEKVEKKQVHLKQQLQGRTEKMGAILLEEFPSIGEKVLAFRKHLRLLKNELATENEKLERLKQLEAEHTQLLQNKRTTMHKISYLLETTGVKTEAEFKKLYELKKIHDEKESRLQFLQENMPDLKDIKFKTKKEIEIEEKKISKQIQELAVENKQVLRQQANIHLTIEKIEKDGTYTEKLQEFANKKAIIQNYVDEWISNKLAAGMIRKILDQVTEEKFTKIIKDAESYFSILTDEDYEKIHFQKDKLFVQTHRGNIVDVRDLSRGTAEPLYVAIRFAYIKNTAEKMNLPIIMDDPFVNFDQKRKENMYHLLRKLSKELQIIYFSFDTDVVNYFYTEEITKLNTV